jgi:peptidylprolyl isomerase
MKRLLIAYSLTTASLLFAGCNECTTNTEQKNKALEIITEYKKCDSGLKYKIIKDGSGICPQKNQNVTVHYTGWLDKNGTTGTKFDSSVDRGTPFTFVIGAGQVIRGWDEGVMTMKVGEKRRLIIPANLGYGSHGAGQVIPPNATLIFDVELIEIK